MRFLIDDAPWCPAGTATSELAEGLEALAERLDTAREREESVGVYAGIWQMSLVDRFTLLDLLYDAENPARLPQDLRLALGRFLDAASSFDDEALDEFEAEVAGVKLTSPAAVLTHGKIASRAAVACLTPRCSGRYDALAVSVGGALQTVRYVADEATHLAFFRAAIVVENADEDAFEALAPHAFPDLAYADNLWRGLRDFSMSYRERRDDLIDALSAFCDHGRRIFALPQSQWIAEFGSVGIDISPESSNDMKGRCLTHRQRQRGNDLVTFEWHIKLDRHVDRIHVHPGHGYSDGRPIVGIFTRHLPLSSRGEC